METVKQHFEAEAQKFDRLIRILIPCYMQMLEALIQVIPFERHQSIRALDLGSGTGTVAGQVLQAFPNAHVTCIDFAENMIEMARSKLAAHQNVRYLVQDFSTLPDDAPFQLIEC